MMDRSIRNMFAVAASAFTVGMLVNPSPTMIVERGQLVAPADAVIGRPATPMSYAGVARRTTRRVIVRSSIYVAALPRGCTQVVISGTALWQCGVTYYQQAGPQYVVVQLQ